MFKGRGSLVSHKALEDWSANQPGDTFRMRMRMRETGHLTGITSQSEEKHRMRGERSQLSYSCFSEHGNLIGGKKDQTMVQKHEQNHS